MTEKERRHGGFWPVLKIPTSEASKSQTKRKNTDWRKDFREPVYTVETWGEEQAERYLRLINQSFRKVADNPGLGRSCDTIREGPDAGRIEFSIDDDDYRTTDTFTRWSTGLHLPWAVILDDDLKDSQHTVKVRIAEGHHPKGNGTALRVFHLLLN